MEDLILTVSIVVFVLLLIVGGNRLKAAERRWITMRQFDTAQGWGLILSAVGLIGLWVCLVYVIFGRG